jgi:hypothetical protein
MEMMMPRGNPIRRPRGADPAVPRTLFELLYYGPAQFGGCPFSFFVSFFVSFLFYFSFFCSNLKIVQIQKVFKFENCSNLKIVQISNFVQI